MRIVKYPGGAFERWGERLEKGRAGDDRKIRRTVEKLVGEVRREGDAAVSRHLAALDQVRIAPEEIRISAKMAPIADPIRRAIDQAIEQVQAFHRRQAIDGFEIQGEGVSLRHRVRPLSRVGIYVPGGRAVYLSTLIMCAIPARIAGVKELAVATTPSAAAHPELLYTASLLGVTDIYRAGGASGIAALAYGTESLPRVDKIVGPGNAYVTAAKQMVSGDVGIDMTAGPSEVIVIADSESSPKLVAADLLAQAEHGEDSSAICVTTSRAFAGRLSDEVDRQLESLPDGSAAGHSIKTNGVIFFAKSDAAVAELVNRIGPEHVSIQTAQAFDPDLIENCGALYVGRYAAVALGDYVIGPNHVLPTAGSARYSSPLGVYDFVKRSNVIRVEETGYRRLADSAEVLARFEGLPMHARSVVVRGDAA
ncbi:MAG: histidinol dehydrogenase [Thermoanaerobaculia bacterium]